MTQRAPRRCVIVGGGISGLAAAHRLAERCREAQQPLAITVVEAQERFGGLLDTQRRDGFLLEGGADAFVSDKPWAAALCERVGLGGELVPTEAACRRSFLVWRGRLAAVPEGWALFAPARLAALWRMPAFSWRGKLRAACEPFIPPSRDGAEESLSQFVRRRCGREALERVAQPMLSAIYAADPDGVSLHATMPQWLELEQRYGSLWRGLRARARAPRGAQEASGPRYGVFLTLRGGLGRLVERLIERMPEVTLRGSATVKEIQRGERWTLRLADGEQLEAEALCLALPGPHAAALLQSCAPELAARLAQMPYASVATVNVGLRRDEVAHPLDGFGFVVPRLERRRLLGCTFSSVKFPGRAPQASVLLRAFVGGALQPDLMALDDEALVRVVLEELRDLVGLRAIPRLIAVSRYERAMPHYPVGHGARVEAIEASARRYPGLALIGNGYHGIGIPDCVHHAEETAERIFLDLEALPQPPPLSDAATASRHNGR